MAITCNDFWSNMDSRICLPNEAVFLPRLCKPVWASARMCREPGCHGHDNRVSMPHAIAEDGVMLSIIEIVLKASPF